MRLVGPVIGILAQDDDFDGGVGGLMEGSKDLIGRRIDGVVLTLIGHKGLELLPVGLGKLVAQDGIPVGTWGHRTTVEPRASSATVPQGVYASEARFGSHGRVDRPKDWHRWSARGSLLAMTTLELVQAVAEPLGNAGAAFYFQPSTLGKGKELGLDGMRFYVLGRGGVLGNVEAPVVASAFGYFNPGLIATMWDSARDVLEPREAGRIYHECAADIGRQYLSDTAGLAEFNEAAEAVIAAAHPAGLSLFAGLAAEPTVRDPAGRAQQLAAVLRELRGSAHLLAVVATGIEPRVAHAAKRPEMVQAFGYPETPELPSDIGDRLAAAEALTNQILLPAYSVLSDEQAKALRSGSEALAATLPPIGI